jgi:hypothetical protein
MPEPTTEAAPAAAPPLEDRLRAKHAELTQRVTGLDAQARLLKAQLESTEQQLEQAAGALTEVGELLGIGPTGQPLAPPPAQPEPEPVPGVRGGQRAARKRATRKASSNGKAKGK